MCGDSVQEQWKLRVQMLSLQCGVKYEFCERILQLVIDINLFIGRCQWEAEGSGGEEMWG